MHALLWSKNEKEILKKVTLAEAYNEVAKFETNSWMPKSFNEIDTTLTLYQALRDAFGGSGSTDYISDNNLKISPNEDSKFKSLQKDYAIYYNSGFGATSQIEALKTVLK